MASPRASEPDLSMFRPGSLPSIHVGDDLSACAPASFLLNARGHLLAANPRGLAMVSGGLVGEQSWVAALPAVRTPRRLELLLSDAVSAGGSSVEGAVCIGNHRDVIVRCAAPLEDLIVAVVVDASHASAPPLFEDEVFPEARTGRHVVFVLDRASLLPFHVNAHAAQLLRGDAESPRERAFPSLVVPSSRARLVRDACLVADARVWTGPYEAADGRGMVDIGIIASEYGGLAALVAVVR